MTTRLFPESYARDLLHCLNVKNVPVDPWEICEKLDIKVCYEPFKQCEALLCIKNGRKKIILNENIPYYLRHKFSLAHEIGHYWIPSHKLQVFTCFASDIMAFKTNKVQEEEANRFASELLMPSEYITKDAKLYDYNAESIRKIADKYNVSITAAAIRFLEVTPDKAAIILSQNGTIKWFMRAKNFKHFIKTKTIDSATYIYDFYHNGEINESLNQAYAGAWLEDPGDLDFINEQSIIMPSLNMALTILTIPYDEDNEYDNWADY